MADTVAKTDSNVTEMTINYEEAYKKAIAERDSYKLEAEKQKGLKDKYASENADYKKKAEDYKKQVESQMSEEEKKAKEWQELLDSKKEMESKLSQMQLEKDLLANGFTTEESEKLIKGNFAVKDIATIIKERVDSAVKSAQAEFTKNSTSQSLMGKGSTDGKETKSAFQSYQESKKTTNNIVEL